MKVVRVEAGAPLCNNYILVNEEIDKGVFIDCSGDGMPPIIMARRMGIFISAVLLTHGHYDHIGGVDAAVENYYCPIYIHKFDADCLKRPDYNLSARMYQKNLAVSAKPTLINDGDVIEAAGLKIDVIHTPGHTPGSVCYRIDDYLFTGDTLFRGSIGADLPPFGDMNMEIDSIRSMLFTIPEDLQCCPGHGMNTTLQREMKENIYCRL